MHSSGHCAHRVANLCKSAANAPFRGWGTPCLQPKSNVTFELASLDIFKTLAADLGFKYFYYSGHCAHRVANLRKSAANAPFRGWGTPCLQPKSNVTFELASLDIFKTLAADLGFQYFYYSGHCAHRVANLRKSAANAPFRGWGTPCLQPKSNVTFELASLDIFKTLAADLGFKYFHYSGHCAHRVANLGKSTANAPFMGWEDTLVATKKYCNF